MSRERRLGWLRRWWLRWQQQRLRWEMEDHNFRRWRDALPVDEAYERQWAERYLDLDHEIHRHREGHRG